MKKPVTVKRTVGKVEGGSVSRCRCCWDETVLRGRVLACFLLL
jgi:hypothetical protein